MADRQHLWSPSANLKELRSAGLTSAQDGFRAVEILPAMKRVNGVGTILLGWIADPALGDARVKLLWFTILFIPVLPLRAYAVTGDSSGYCFRGEMSLLAFLRRYRWRVMSYLITALVEAILRAALLLGCALFALLLVYWIAGRL